MLSPILLGALVLMAVVFAAVDIFRTESDLPHGHGDGSAHDARLGGIAATRSGQTDAFLWEDAGTGVTAGTGVAAAVHDADPIRRPESVSSSAADLQPSRPGPMAVSTRSSRRLKDWPVRSRLWLLVIIPAVAVAVAAFGIARTVGGLQGTSIHTMSDRAILLLLAVGVVVIVVLASWFTIVTARSLLRPLYRLRGAAREVTAGRLPPAARRTSQSNGQGTPSDVEPVDEDSSDEMGEIARAFNQMRRELSRQAADDATLHDRLNAVFENLSHRSQALAERQIRLAENLEQGEQDAERMARLVKMSRIATRMRRNSQNLLVLAGHDLSSSWNQPVALVSVISAAVSEIEEYERVSINAQPDIAVRGPAVSDVMHLLAELTENATSFSAADMPVDISGQLLTTGGVLIDITDRGLGMGAKEMAYANWQLENPSAAEANVPRWMGLFVVSRLAARHAIRVRLQPAEFGGLTALVWLPDEVLIHQGAAVLPRLGVFGSGGSRPGSSGAEVDSGHAAVESASDTNQTPEIASAPSATAAVLSQQTGSADLGLIVPSVEGPQETHRLPIFDAVESRWFSDGRMPSGSSGMPAVADSRWSSPADEGWRAADTVSSPYSGASTAAGLPRRLPNANLVPGAIPSTQPMMLNRSAATARDRLAGFQRGVREARAASSEVTRRAGEDESGG